MLDLSHLDVKREELEPIFKREGVELVTTWTTGVDGPKEEALAAAVRFYHDHFDLFMEALGGPEHKPAAMVKPAYRPPEPVATNRPAVPPLKDQCVTCLVYFGCSLDGLTNHAFHACHRRPQLSGAYRKTISRNLAAVVNSSAAQRYGALAWFGWGR